MNKFNVLLFQDIHPAGKKILQGKADIVIAESLEESHLVKQVVDVDAIVVRSNAKLTRRIMEAAPRLKVVGRHGVGVENIDLDAATEMGIWVASTPNANNQSVAEHFFGLAIMMIRMMKESNVLLHEGRWQERHHYIGHEIQGKTLGILGFGRVGKTIGRIGFKGFDMRILYHDLLRFEVVERELHAMKVGLEEVMAQSDFISINLPLTPETKGMVGSRELTLMKPTAYILNLARGPIWDEQAVEKVLRERKIAGAGSDVYEVEPAAKDHPLLALDNFVGTPHMAAHTEEALEKMSLVAQDIVRVLDGKEPLYPVNRPVRRKKAGS